MMMTGYVKDGSEAEEDLQSIDVRAPVLHETLSWLLKDIFLVPYQCPPCLLQPRFQCSFRSSEDGGKGGGGSTAADEWGYRDKSRACW